MSNNFTKIEQEYEQYVRASMDSGDNDVMTYSEWLDFIDRSIDGLCI